jgi:hypothetical protein
MTHELHAVLATLAELLRDGVYWTAFVGFIGRFSVNRVSRDQVGRLHAVLRFMIPPICPLVLRLSFTHQSRRISMPEVAASSSLRVVSRKKSWIGL